MDNREFGTNPKRAQHCDGDFCIKQNQYPLVPLASAGKVIQRDDPQSVDRPERRYTRLVQRAFFH